MLLTTGMAVSESMQRARLMTALMLSQHWTAPMKFKGDDTNQTKATRLLVNHNFGKDVAVTLGRQGVVFGNQGGWLYGDYSGYDGAQVAYNNGKLNATVGFGQFNSTVDAVTDFNNSDALFAKLALLQPPQTGR